MKKYKVVLNLSGVTTSDEVKADGWVLMEQSIITFYRNYYKNLEIAEKNLETRPIMSYNKDYVVQIVLEGEQ